MPKWNCRLPARTYEGSMDAMKIGRHRLTDVVSFCIERMLDAGEGRTPDVGGGRSPSRSDLGAALWGGLAILLVKVAVAALILLAL